MVRIKDQGCVVVSNGPRPHPQGPSVVLLRADCGDPHPARSPQRKQPGAHGEHGRQAIVGNNRLAAAPYFNTVPCNTINATVK